MINSYFDGLVKRSIPQFHASTWPFFSEPTRLPISANSMIAVSPFGMVSMIDSCQEEIAIPLPFFKKNCAGTIFETP